MFTVKEQAFFFLFLASFSTILASWIVFVVLLAGHKIEPDTHSLRLFSLSSSSVCFFLLSERAGTVAGSSNTTAAKELRLNKKNKKNELATLGFMHVFWISRGGL